MENSKIILPVLITCCVFVWVISSLDNVQPSIPSHTASTLEKETSSGEVQSGEVDLESVSADTEEKEKPSVEKRGDIVKVKNNDTLNGILSRHKVSAQERYSLSTTLSRFYDLRRLRPGVSMEILFAEKPESTTKQSVQRFRILVDSDSLVELNRLDDGTFEGELKDLQHTPRIRTVSASIDSSFFLSAREMGIPRKISAEFHSMLGARVDFQREIRKGNTYRMVYEENDDTPFGGIHAGRMLYASLTMNDRSVGYYRYTTDDGFSGYFDENGHSVDTQLLKTPLSSGRLSSLYGKRTHPVYGYQKMHRGIDFAARKGTPILAAGDGVIERVGWYGNYGKMIKIRHGSIFVTAYAHMSGYAKGMKPGVRVRQGDVIGYVGSTGLTTGPNLHYEVLRHGKRINPMTLKLPPARTLKDEELVRFKEYLKRFEPRIPVQAT